MRRINVDSNSESASAREFEKNHFGHDIHVRYHLGRHQDPAIDLTTGKKLDKLSAIGVAQASTEGKELHGVIKGYASPMQRARETVDLRFQNAAEDAAILNRRVADVKNEGARASQHGREFVIRTKPELRLRSVQTIVPFWKEATAFAKSEIAAGRANPEQMDNLSFQYYFDHPERAVELGAPAPHELAQELGYNVRHFADMAERFKDGSQLTAMAVTHGPKIESFVREVIVRDVGGKQVKGFEQLDEIGGMFEPGEGPEFKIDRDEDGNESIKMVLRGKEYDVDTAALQQLSDEYVQRLKREKIEKSAQ